MCVCVCVCVFVCVCASVFVGVFGCVRVSTAWARIEVILCEYPEDGFLVPL